MNALNDRISDGEIIPLVSNMMTTSAIKHIRVYIA